MPGNAAHCRCVRVGGTRALCCRSHIGGGENPRNCAVWGWPTVKAAGAGSGVDAMGGRTAPASRGTAVPLSPATTRFSAVQGRRMVCWMWQDVPFAGQRRPIPNTQPQPLSFPERRAPSIAVLEGGVQFGMAESRMPLAPAHQPLGSANAATTPARAPATAADRTQRRNIRNPTQHAKGRTGDCPGPRKGTTTRRNVTQGGGGGGHQLSATRAPEGVLTARG